MTEEIEQEKPEEEKDLTCPECGKGFQDMRGLTSHARHMHDLSKEEVASIINDNKKGGKGWKLLGGFGTILLAIITVGKIK